MKQSSEYKGTVSHKIIFPRHLNDNNCLFGGKVLEWMDEAAYITGIEYAQKRLVTIGAESIKFLHPVKSGDIIKICGKVTEVGAVILKVKVEIHIDNPISGCYLKSSEGIFKLAAVNSSNKPERLKKRQP